MKPHKYSVMEFDNDIPYVVLTKNSKNYMSQLKYYSSIVTSKDCDLERIIEFSPILIILYTENHKTDVIVHYLNNFVESLNNTDFMIQQISINKVTDIFKLYYNNEEVKKRFLEIYNRQIIFKNGIVEHTFNSEIRINDTDLYDLIGRDDLYMLTSKFIYYYGEEELYTYYQNNKNVRGIVLYEDFDILLTKGWTNFDNIEYVNETNDDLMTLENLTKLNEYFPKLKYYLHHEGYGVKERHIRNKLTENICTNYNPKGLREFPPLEVLDFDESILKVTSFFSEESKDKIPYDGIVVVDELEKYSTVVFDTFKKCVNVTGKNMIWIWDFYEMEDLNLYALMFKDELGTIYIPEDTNEIKVNLFVDKYGSDKIIMYDEYFKF